MIPGTSRIELIKGHNRFCYKYQDLDMFRPSCTHVCMVSDIIPMHSLFLLNKFLMKISSFCSKDGFPSLRHNEIRDLIADLTAVVCSNFCSSCEVGSVASTLKPASANAHQCATIPSHLR